MTKIKICGITNIDDALLSVRLGADMIGFNFYENSPRYIEPSEAASIIQRLNGSVEKVGIFVNETVGRLREIVELARLDAVQLHGDESPVYVGELAGVKVIKAFRIDKDFNLTQLERFDVDAVLVDAYSADEFGGTGKTCDWTTAKKIAEKFPNMFLSGGLSAENVAAAVKQVKPYAVDACSLLETEKGKKDASKLEEFIAAARWG
jgi:phosphoribosylanthranilate isomerase